MKKFGVLFVFFLFAACYVGICGCIELYIYSNTPAIFASTNIISSEPEKILDTEQIVNIKFGDSFYGLSGKLSRLNIIRDAKRFSILARLYRFDMRIKAGEYLLSSSMTPLTVLERLATGKIFLRKVTIPEGYNLKQIASVINQVILIPEKDFIDLATNASVALEMGIQADSCEGYLFPDTYYFSRDMSAKKIIETMVKRFNAVFTSEWLQRAKEMGFSVHQIVSLASVIEKETGQAQERPVISSVFHNRLKKDMRLESDPTVIYGIENFDGNLTKEHLETPTPYNTYRMKGLPIGPIASPGKNSLYSALYPQETPFLYFVSKKDGYHQFSDNLDDHNKAVAEYQKNNKK